MITQGRVSLSAVPLIYTDGVIRILHLSDLHFGPHSRFPLDLREAERQGKAFHKALVAASIERKVDLVIVTGDVAEAAKDGEFAAGEAFLSALSGELGLAPERFVFVPGNHDVSRFRCQEVAILQEEHGFDSDELRRRMDDVKLRHYDDFLRRFYGVDELDEVADPLVHGARLYNYPDLRLSVAALNSCEVESHRSEDHRGVVSKRQAQAVLDAWRLGEMKNRLKIVAVHHNPVATTRNNVESWRDYLRGTGGLTGDLVGCYESDVVGLDGRDYLEKIARDARVQLVLHGHHHARDVKSFKWQRDGETHVLSTGSLTLHDGKLPRDEPASVRMIHLDPKAERLEARSLVFIGWARTEGELDDGAFKPDPDEPDDYGQPLYPPEGWELRPEEDGEEGVRVDRAFVRAYRKRMRHLFSRWDLAHVGVVQPGGAGRPIEAQLDDMYLPLRLASGFNINELDRGTPIGPDELLQRETPLVIRGAGGSGKTTWMRWTFRRLLEGERSLPLMIVLRDLARRWADDECIGEARSLDAFLESWVAENAGGGYESELRKVLESSDGPRPVLLVDGWDELGELGEELRSRLLGFMEQYPQLLVLASSRPYGEGVPSSSDQFQILDIQPLSNAEIGNLTQRFLSQCYGEDEATVNREEEYFEAALDRSLDARGLARTALLLTMMLLISRSRPLPDKRHQLYEACVENLLTAMPDRKEQRGAQLQEAQWRPDDSEERMRVVAALAYGVQREGGQPLSNATVVSDWTVS